MLALIKEREYQHLCFIEEEMRSHGGPGEPTAKFREAFDGWLVGVLRSAGRG